MGQSLARKLIESHLLEGEMVPGEEVGIRIEQTLTQDATGTLVMLELEAMGLDRARTEVSCQYVDHNLIQEDFKNGDDHLFLMSAAQRFGLWFSRAGNGVSHPVHQEHFARPGESLLGSDSHTAAAGAMGMLAIGTGGLEVALAIAGQPYYFRMPEFWGVRLTGKLPDWVSAKDIILEMLRRYGVKGGMGRIIEYHGPGLTNLSAMDRHVIANMGAELGATATVFPSDHAVKTYLSSHGRERDFVALAADANAHYDVECELDLASLVPLVALPSSPDKVVPVAEVAGAEIAQSYIGSSANPGYRDLAMVAEVVKGRAVHPRVSLDVNPASRKILMRLAQDGHLTSLLQSGARLHQAGCNGCIGMGQAPASDTISLRTVPRNFPARSGTLDDRVYLVSPETAAASALTGVITDPRSLDMAYPRIEEPDHYPATPALLIPPLSPGEARTIKLRKGPNIGTLPALDPLAETIEVPVLLMVGDNLSTDEILRAGAGVLPYRSNIPKISEFAFDAIDATYHRRALASRENGGHCLVAGENYGQGSSREHAALVPRFLGLRMVLAESFARIHWQNLVNFGVVPLTFVDKQDRASIRQGHVLRIDDARRRLAENNEIEVENVATGRAIPTAHTLSRRQVDILLRGGLINWLREQLQSP